MRPLGWVLVLVGLASIPAEAGGCPPRPVVLAELEITSCEALNPRNVEAVSRSVRAAEKKPLPGRDAQALRVGAATHIHGAVIEVKLRRTRELTDFEFSPANAKASRWAPSFAEPTTLFYKYATGAKPGAISSCEQLKAGAVVVVGAACPRRQPSNRRRSG